VDQIIRESGPIDVYIISGAPDTKRSVPIETEAWQPHRPWLRYLQSLLLVGAGTLLSEIVRPLFSPTNLVMIYLLRRRRRHLPGAGRLWQQSQ
jgi:K+-sensing histidine kinase KdpD